MASGPIIRSVINGGCGLVFPDVSCLSFFWATAQITRREGGRIVGQMRHDFWRQLKFFGANLGFHRRESNSRQNECGKSMKLDFEARSATFEEKWIAMTHDFQPSRKKMNQMFKQCLEHLCFRACFCAKRAKLGWMHSFCTSFQMAILLKNKEGGSMTDIRKNQSTATIDDRSDDRPAGHACIAWVLK